MPAAESSGACAAVNQPVPDIPLRKYPAAGFMHAALRVVTFEWASHVGLVLIACYVAGRLSPVVQAAGGGGALVSAASGIALASMLRLGLRVWPGVWLAAFCAALASGFSSSPSWIFALLVACGGTAGPLLGAAVLQRFGFGTGFTCRRDLRLFAVFGLGAAMAISAGVTALSLAATNRAALAAVPADWVRGWLCDALGALIVGVPLLAWSRTSLERAFSSDRWPETTLLVVAAMASAAAAWAAVAAQPAVAWPLVFVPYILLCRLASRNGLFVASATVMVIAVGVMCAPTAGWASLAKALQSGVGVSVGSGTEVEYSTAFLSALLSTLLFGLSAAVLLTAAFTGELAAADQHWKTALDTSGIGLAEWDLRQGRLDFSPRWLTMLGYATQAFGHTIAAFWARVHAEDAPAVQEAFESLRSANVADCRAECRMLCADGQWRWFELHGLVATRGHGREPTRILTTARDVTELHAAHERQQLSESLFLHLHEGLLVTDAEHRVLDANPMFFEITGLARDEVLSRVPALLRPATAGSPGAAQQQAMHASLAAEGTWRGEIVDTRRNGESCTLQVTASAVRDVSGVVRNHVLAISDITTARQQLEKLQRQAHFDELTRLPNRSKLAQMLRSALIATEREGSLLTVCYLDLDHFKPVNDQFGHEAGDRLLVELAERMRRSLRSWAGGDDVVARIGGDEFVLLLRTATLEESRHAVERVLRQVCQPYSVVPGEAPVTVTASIGATVYPLDRADAETLLRHADHAMYGAKQAGRNGYLFFDAEHDKRAEARFVALGRVQEALDAGEFCLYYQPKVDMRLGTVQGFEALLRWKHPEQGVVSPAQFLPLIENTGLSIGVGNWVLQHGIEQLARWLRFGLDMTVSINVSARHLQEPLFAKHLAALLTRHAEPVASHLIIEVLETTALADIDYTCGLMDECRALGVRFALDDFGTGYSTLTYLKRLPLDMLKIDRSFVTNMLHDRQDLAIVEGVIGLSQTFGCAVVAEGVETPQQAQRLIEIGCDVGQGNGIAPAMPAEEVIAWVDAYRGVPGRVEMLEA
ncbi:hypothetical protein BH11PSE8_BH11PSE8_24860 [soil metagenome]